MKHLPQTEPHFPVLTDHFSCSEYVKEKENTSKTYSLKKGSYKVFWKVLSNGREAESGG